MNSINAISDFKIRNITSNKVLSFGETKSDTGVELERSPQNDSVQIQNSDAKKERKSLVKKYLITGLAALAVVGTTVYMIYKKGKINSESKAITLKPDPNVKFESPVKAIDFGKLPQNLETDISKLKKQGKVNEDGTEIVIKYKDKTIRKYQISAGENPQIEKVCEYASEAQANPYRITEFSNGKPSQIENIKSEMDSYITIL